MHLEQPPPPPVASCLRGRKTCSTTLNAHPHLVPDAREDDSMATL